MKLVKLCEISEVLNSLIGLKKYIYFNTDKGTNAANSFEKDCFKLMNNSTLGKTIKKLRKRMNVMLVNNARDY